MRPYGLSLACFLMGAIADQRTSLVNIMALPGHHHCAHWSCLCSGCVGGPSDQQINNMNIVVSNIVTWQHEAILDAHNGAVRALAVSGQTQLSTGASVCGRLVAGII